MGAQQSKDVLSYQRLSDCTIEGVEKLHSEGAGLEGEVDGLKKSNALLNQEVSRLQKQVKRWKQKSDKQDSDIRKLQNAAKQAESLASNKDAKSKIAVDVFKCILSQLNELTKKLPPGISNDETFKDLTDKVNYYITTHGSDASSSNISEAENQKPIEVTEQFEPGVYLTALRLSDGTKELKRVQFSKKRFNPPQAEQWWKENREKLFKIHNYVIKV